MRKRLTTSSLVVFYVLTFLISGVSVANAVDVRTVDVVSVSWQGAKNLSVSVGDVEQSIRNEVNSNWIKFTTLEGDSRDRAISFELGRTLASPIIVSKPMACEGSESLGFMESIRAVAYERLGIKDSKSRYLVILSPNNSCVWSGRATMGSNKSPGGTLTLHDTASAFVITHELGHTLGLGHSNFLRCSSGAFDGAWGGDCRAFEYGGTIDVMGNYETSSPLSTYHQWRMGLLESSEIKESWLSEKIELTASDVFGGTRAIFIRDGKSTYWIEYRRAQGSYKAGLAMYRTDPPPGSAIVSPNPSDIDFDFGPGVGIDIWMLNWDNYRYTGSRPSGSMTLPQGRIASLFSKNVSISAEPMDEKGNKVLVTINRRADTTPPPLPVLSDPAKWNFPGFEILQEGYEDGESIITGYEALVNENLVQLEASETENWAATYLSPISTLRRLHVRDLPEGTYNLKVRAKDIWGNTSQWSAPQAVTIDRGEPIAANEFKVAGVSKDDVELSWVGARDLGTGLCETVVVNKEGWVLQRSTEKTAPKLRFPINSKVSADTQIYDCRGNGKTVTLSVENSTLTAESRKGRSGAWSSAPKEFGSGALNATGKCSISFTVKGEQTVLMGDGAAEVLVNGRLSSKIPNSNSGTIRTSETFSVGSKNAVVRVQGKNFVIAGLSKISTQVLNANSVSRSVQAEDLSLSESTQKRLSNLGFRVGDFAQEWSVLPMARGTTLLDPTLDLCGNTYKSESGREFRRQISVTKQKSTYAFLSTEVVQYKSKSEAETALEELKTNFALCVKNGGGVENGVFTDYEFQKLPNFKDNLVDSKDRVIVRATIGKGAAARQLFGVYQFNGEFFTGLYIVKFGESPIPEDEILRWLDVASTMASRLKSASSSF